MQKTANVRRCGMWKQNLILHINNSTAHHSRGSLDVCSMWMSHKQVYRKMLHCWSPFKWSAVKLSASKRVKQGNANKNACENWIQLVLNVERAAAAAATGAHHVKRKCNKHKFSGSFPLAVQQYITVHVFYCECDAVNIVVATMFLINGFSKLNHGFRSILSFISFFARSLEITVQSNESFEILSWLCVCDPFKINYSSLH